MSESPERPDYVWHFQLSNDASERVGEDALTEMVRQQVRAILQCVILTSNGVDLAVTGFRFLNEPGREHVLNTHLTDGASPDAESASHLQGGTPESGSTD